MDGLRTVLAGSLLLALGACAAEPPADTPAAEEWRAALNGYAGAVRGRDGWLFLATELRAYGKWGFGRFWGDDAANTAVSAANPDPLPAILDFHAQLAARGIPLLLVPVPGKVCVYPDKLDTRLKPDERHDLMHQEFYRLLAKEGIEVLDLLPDLQKLRREGVEAFCRQDTHWSPRAVKLAARKVAERIKAQPWRKQLEPRWQVNYEEEKVEVRGDLAILAALPDAPKETLTVERVKIGGQYVVGDPDGPVMLLGDSSSLVYHKRELLSDSLPVSHAGLADHLAAELGVRIEVLGSLGSGANGSRLTLQNKAGSGQDPLAGKKCAVWCFAAREFTEAPQGWVKLSLAVKPAKQP